MPKTRRLSDATLVRRSQQGDRRAFSALLSRYDWRLRGLAHALLLDRGEMDAALALGYLRAWRDVVRINPKDDVAAWLYRVTYNACIDQMRRAPTPAEVPPDGDAGLAAGLATLPAAERVAVVLVDREGFPPAAAARILGLAPEVLAATLDAAREHLTPHLPPPPVERPAEPAAATGDVDDPGDEAATAAESEAGAIADSGDEVEPDAAAGSGDEVESGAELGPLVVVESSAEPGDGGELPGNGVAGEPGDVLVAQQPQRHPVSPDGHSVGDTSPVRTAHPNGNGGHPVPAPAGPGPEVASADLPDPDQPDGGELHPDVPDTGVPETEVAATEVAATEVADIEVADTDVSAAGVSATDGPGTRVAHHGYEGAAARGDGATVEIGPQGTNGDRRSGGDGATVEIGSQGTNGDRGSDSDGNGDSALAGGDGDNGSAPNRGRGRRARRRAKHATTPAPGETTDPSGGTTP